jgi:hypothetical protein
MLDDLEADIAAALKGETSAPVEAVEVAPVEAPPVEAATETAEERQVRIDADGRARAKDGKFASKDGKPPAIEVTDPAQPKIEEAATTDKAAPKHRPHTHWTPELKAAFVDMPEHLQKALLDREADMDKGKNEWAAKADDFNKLNKVIEPMRGRWAMQGLTPEIAIGQLVSAANLLQDNPLMGFEHLLKTYAGANYLRLINQIALKDGYALYESDNQGYEPTQGQQPDYMADPTVRRMNEELTALKQWREQREQSEASQVQTSMAAEVDSVRNDPKNMFFENVKDNVAIMARAMMDRGDKRSTREIVQDAYDQAVWANPTTRTLQMQATQKANAEADQKAKAEAAAKARNAAVSITGSPGQGAPAARQPGPTGKNRTDDIMADVRAAMSAGRA